MREMQVRRKRLAFSVRDLKGSLSHSETSYAVTTTRTDASLSGSTITIHGRLFLATWIMNRPSTTLGSNPVARSSIARTSTSVTPRRSIRNSACGVNESSQLHQNGNAGLEVIGNVG